MVRALLAMVVVLEACGGPPTRSTAPPILPSRAATVRHPGADPTPVDVIAGLAEASDEAVAWLDPGPARLELGGAALEPTEGVSPLGVAVLEAQGKQLHVAVRLEEARFAVWTDRARLLGVAKRDLRVADAPGGGTGIPSGEGIEAVIRRHAHVHVLAHKDRWAQILYAGAVEIIGWVPDDAIGDRSPPLHGTAFFPKTSVLNVIPGSIIRAEPAWQGRQLAVVASTYFVDRIKDIDDTWVEAEISDDFVSVHGYLSRHEPPGRLHQRRARDVQPVVATPTATVPSGTCLYARANGDPIGYLVGDRPVELVEATQPGWSSIALDTPWGVVAFAARGAAKAELEACAPPGTVPATTMATPSVP